ncbi:MAG: T9SS type A sorting domain-containing protein [Chlorobi bacterium]|nr:T9SS type A sorting domain-containing protein [Chlorobiota bacterium]
MMKHVIAVLLSVSAVAVRSQFLAPFTAAEGMQSATQTAQQAGIVSAGIDAIYTTGDTSLLAQVGGSLGGALSLSFNFDRGTNTVWLYSVRGKTQNNRDTAIIYAVIKLVAFYQAFPMFGVPGLGQLEQMRGEAALPATFMNSNLMVRKLAEDSTFRAFRQNHPRAILLGASLASIRLSPTSQPAPVWSVLLGGGTLIEPTPPTLNCFVEAGDTSGTARCFEVPIASVTSGQEQDWTLSPTPATDVVSVHVPFEELLYPATIEIRSLCGDLVMSHALTTISASNAISIPVSSLPSGMYLLRYRSKRTVRTLPLFVSR